MTGKDAKTDKEAARAAALKANLRRRKEGRARPHEARAVDADKVAD